jgi:hypothetical protein
MASTRPGSAYLTTTGQIGNGAGPVRVYGFHVIAAGATPPVVVIKNTSASGTIFIQETGTASKGQTFNYGEGFYFPAGAYYTADANQTSVLFSYEQVA